MYIVSNDRADDDPKFMKTCMHYRDVYLCLISITIFCSPHILPDRYT